MAWIPAAIGAAGAIGGALIGRSGQKSTNKASEDEAALNRQFQEDLSNTAVQRRMADMKKAGINPILAAKYDASTPAGAMANFGNPGAAFTQGFAQVGGTAKQLLTMTTEIEQMQSRTGLNEKQTDVLSLVASLSTKGESMLDTITDFLSGESDEIMQFLTTIPGEIQGAVSNVLQELKSKIQQGMDMSGEWLNQMSQSFQQSWRDVKVFLNSKRTDNQELGPIVIDKGKD